jgi:hypothetical protein
MRTWGTIFVIVLAVVTAAAFPNQVSVDDLKARLQRAKPDDRANICLEIAEQQVKTADTFFRDGKVEEAQAAIQDVVSYSKQAGEQARLSGHHLKKMEITMRKMTHRLADIKRTIAYENQAPVQSAIDSLEKIRTDLLDRMFGKKAK